MEIISVIPRGYCQGVVRAIQIAHKTAREHTKEPVYMLGMIVHNQFVVEACKKEGIQFIESPDKTRLELLDEIDHGIVIFTAHGISDAVRKKAADKHLTIVDASCPDVEKTHKLVKDHIAKGGDVLYIGKKGHPESEGTVSLSDHVHLITSKEDINHLKGLRHVLITNQTTLSILDTKDIIEACLKAYPDAQVSSEICNATRIRQEAVMHLKDVDVLIVVGDKRSNNSNQLKQIGLSSGIHDAYLIDSVSDLQEDMVKGRNRIAVTSGSSTPNELTKQVIDFLKQYALDGKWNLPEPASVHLI
ncbi:MAG: 4-hydroxy-3-methylbut-2-enyl diphosphate reductase [Erysipelotrichaceae bacterium]|nr:4-hydroxy-3-methylbut-2-enyl diphosphate reductase [Erysipelotrichaceae bacterium]